MKILDRKDAMNRRLYQRLIIVETAIYRVSCLNRTVLMDAPSIDEFIIPFLCPTTSGLQISYHNPLLLLILAERIKSGMHPLTNLCLCQ